MDSVTPLTLKSHPAWTSLTERQQAFCLDYIESRDPVSSVQRTHKVNNLKSAEAVAGRIMRNFKVLRVLNMTGSVIEGVLVSRAEALQLMSDRLRSVKTDNADFVKILTIYERMSGWVKPSAPTEPEKDSDGFDDVLALEKKRKHNG